MTNLRDAARSGSYRLLATFACAASLLAATGCEEKQAAPTAPAESAPAPRRVERSSLDKVTLHPKVQFPEDLLPASQEATNAIAALASAIAAGDSAALTTMLSGPDQAVLLLLIEEGEWQRQTARLQVVRVSSVEAGSSGLRVGLALQEESGAFLLGWEGTESAGAWQFSSLPIEPRTALTAKELDGAALALLLAPSGVPGDVSTVKPTLAKVEEPKDPGAASDNSGGSSNKPKPGPRKEPSRNRK
jgi:hypothetical protein